MTSSTTVPLVCNVGDRFSPTNEKLVNYFLKQKLLGNNQLVSRIPQLDIYQFDPWDLPWIDSSNGEIYRFSPLHAKNSYTNNGKFNRSTKTGSWQAKGKEYKITSEHSGVKKIFVHSIIKDGIKYVMHEYSASLNLPNQSSLVLCKVMKKKQDKKSTGSCKKVKKTEEKAEVLPYNKDIGTPASDDGSDFEKWISSERLPYNKDIGTPTSDDGSDFEKWISSEKNTDLSTYNNINNKDQQTENSTCDNGGTNHFPDFTILEEVDREILPHLQPFPGYDQQDYSPYHFQLDEQPLMLTEHVHTINGPAGTSASGLEEDSFIGLEPLWA